MAQNGLRDCLPSIEAELAKKRDFSEITSLSAHSEARKIPLIYIYIYIYIYILVNVAKRNFSEFAVLSLSFQIKQDLMTKFYTCENLKF